MDILEYFALSQDDRLHYLQQIRKGDWRAAKYLHSLLESGSARERYGAELKLFLLTRGQELLAFCTYCMRDEIDDPRLFPWVGFVYTFPEYRGKRFSQRLIDHACNCAVTEGHRQMYLTSNELGLYEKYGFSFLEERTTVYGELTRVYVRQL